MKTFLIASATALLLGSSVLASAATPRHEESDRQVAATARSGQIDMAFYFGGCDHVSSRSCGDATGGPVGSPNQAGG